MRLVPSAAALSLLLLTALPGFALAEEAPTQAAPVAENSSPTATYESFKAAVDAAKDDPEQTAKLFVLALVSREADQTLGDGQISLLLRARELKGDSSSPSGFVPSRSAGELLSKISDDALRGYCGGTAAEDYKNADLANCSPSLDMTYSSKAQGRNGNKAKYFVTNTGASRPRPIGLRIEAQQDGGVERWLVDSYSGLLTGVAAKKSDWKQD